MLFLKKKMLVCIILPSSSTFKFYKNVRIKKRENIRSGAGVKPVFYASQSDHATSEKKKLPAIFPLQTAKSSHARKQKNPKSSHTIPLLPSRHSLIAGA